MNVLAAADRAGGRSAALTGTLPRTAVAFLVLVLVWETLGRLRLVGGGALPAPTAIVDALIRDAGVYPSHIAATVEAASAGFVIGNGVAILIAALFVLAPWTERVASLLLVALFCLPVVVVAPILALALAGDGPKIALAALSVFFPTLVSVTVGLRHAPHDAVQLVRASGGGRCRVLRLVRVPAALPELLTGLQIAAPAAILGTILGEFLGGTRGLGVYLLGSMGRADPPTLWAVGLVAATIAAVAYAVFGVAHRVLAPSRVQQVTDMSAGLAQPRGESRTRLGVALRRRPRRAGALWLAAALLFAYAAWRLFVVVTGLPEVVMNTPEQVIASLVTSPTSAAVRADIVAALCASLPPTIAGAAAGIAAAFMLAVGVSLVPTVARTVMPIAFLSQTMPIVALTPLLALLFGRGPLIIVVVTVSVTFFPSFVAILQGINQSPVGPVLVLRSVGAGRMRTMCTAVLPAALPHLFAGVRLAVPRALTGVVLAEQLITGTGLGGALGVARGQLDYRMIWVIATVVGILSVALYLAAERAEHVVRRRFT